MGSESLAMEGAHHGSTSVMSIVLRVMKDAVPESSFGGRKSPGVSFSPSRTLLAVHAESGEIKMYTIAGEEDPSGHELPGFVATEVTSFAWCAIESHFPSLFVTHSESKRSVTVYHFLKDAFIEGEDIHMENGEVKQAGKYLATFSSAGENSSSLQPDFNVLQYSLSYEFLLQTIQTHYKNLQTIDSIELLQNDPFENRLLLSVNHGQIILVLAVTKKGLHFGTALAFPSTTHFSDACEHGSWCFALDSSDPHHPSIHIFNSLDGYYRGAIAIAVDPEMGPATRLSVASDLSTLVAYNTRHSSFQIIDIDAYLLSHAPTSTSNVITIGTASLSINAQTEDENEDEAPAKSILIDQKRARNERMKFLRWYEEGDTRLWSQNGEPAWVARSHIEASGWKPIIQNYVPGTWVTLRASGELKEIDWMIVTPSKIFVSGPAVLDDDSIMVCTVDRQDTAIVSSISLIKNVLPVMESSTAALYFLEGSKLCALIPDQPTDKSKAMGKITNGLIIFDKPDLAELLYKLNGWDKRQLKLNTLRLGLKYRQLDVIAPALKSLDSEEQFKGSQILLEYTQEHRNVVVQDETFWAQLLKLAMEFVSSIMRQKSATITTHPDAFQQITKYAHILTVLRNTNQRLRELVLTGGSASSATSTAESSPHASYSSLKLPNRAQSEKLTKPKASDAVAVSSAAASSIPISAVGSSASQSYKRSISSSIKFSSSLDPTRDSPLQSGPSSFVSNASNSPLDAPSSSSAVDPAYLGSDSMITATTSLISRPETPTIEFSSPFADPSALHDGATSLGSQSGIRSQFVDLEHEQFQRKVQGLEKKVDASVEMSSPFGRLLQRWEKLRQVDIIADALIHGNISTALSYIHWRHITVKSASTWQEYLSTPLPDPTGASIPAMDPTVALKWVVNTACHLIYHCIVLHRQDLAKTIINHLGQDFDEHMKHIAWHTSIKELRHILIPGLLSRSVFNAEEVETIKFSEKLESVYPSSIFAMDAPPSSTGESSNPFGSERLGEDVRSVSDALNIANLADYTIDPFFISNQIATQQDLYETLNPHGKSGTSGTLTMWFRLQYLHNILTADPSTKMRLLLDASLISGQDGNAVMTSSGDSSSPIESIANLMAYFTTHNDWQRLLKWFLEKLDVSLDSLPQALYATLDENGQSITAQDIPEVAKITIDALIQAFSHEEALGKMPPSTRSLIASSLAQRGLFLPSDTSNFAQLLRLLCSTSSLFRDDQKEPSKGFHLDLTTILPMARLAPLHLYFIDLCIEYKLIPLLSSYLNHYNLAKTPETISELLSKISGKSHTWVRLLLHMRHEDSLFEASLANAQISTRSKAPMTVNAMISSNTIKKQPLMALGSLLYAPVSLNECHDAPKTSAWYLDNAQLSDLCSAFPVVHEALFPPQRQLSASTGLPRDHLVLPTPSFDFRSSHQDINLHQLLSRTSQFELTPFTTLRHSSFDARLGDAHPSLAYDFEDEHFDHLRFEDHADVAFFLCQGEPFKAYRWLQNHYASLSGSHRSSYRSPVVPSSPSMSLSSSSSNLGRGAAGARPKPNLNYVTSSIPLHEAPKVMRMVRQVAFQHVYDDTIVASCVALLELCEYKSLDLKVDCKALVRLVDFCSRAPRSVFEEFSLKPLPATSDASTEATQTADKSSSRSASPSFLLNQSISRREALKHLSSLLSTGIGESGSTSGNGLASTSNPSLSTSSASVPAGDSSNPASANDCKSVLVQLSKMLERATELLVDDFEALSKPTSGSSEASTATQVNHWALLVFFNTVHKLPLGEAPLAQLAKRNDWVSFLYYAQVLGYPAEQTLKICDYFTDHSLRDHLIISLSQFAHAPSTPSTNLMSTPKPKETNVEEDQKLDVNQIFQLVLSAASRIYPGEALLQLATSSGRPLLSVLALCFPDVTILNCIIVWLSASVPLETLVEVQEPTTGAETKSSGSPIESMLKELIDFTSSIQITSGSNASNRVSRLLKSTSATAFASPQTSNSSSHAKTHSVDSLHTLSRFIMVLCAKSQLHYILRALEIFEPSHILLQFVRALQLFSQCQFSIAASTMKELFDSLQVATASTANNASRELKVGVRGNASSTGPAVGAGPSLLLGDPAWVQSVVIEVCDCLIKWHCTTSFERREFLKVLAISSPERFEALYREFCLLEKMGLVSSVTDEKSGFVVPSPEFVIQELVKRSKFGDAREFASFCGMNVHEVTVLEAEDLLSRLSHLLKASSHSTLSSMDLAKEKASVWRQINALLIQRKCRPDVAGQFFLDKAQDLEYIVTGAPKPSPTSKYTNFSGLPSQLVDASSSSLDSSNLDFDDVGDDEDDDDRAQDEQELTVEEAATEQIQLLSLARPWLDGSKNHEVGLYPTSFMLYNGASPAAGPVEGDSVEVPLAQRFVPAGGFSNNPNLWVPQLILDDILARLLRLSVLAQAESTKNAGAKGNSSVGSSKSSGGASSLARRNKSSLPQRLAKMDLSNVDPEVLESLVGKLLNQTDSLAEAEKTSKDLNINSREVLVVKVMTELARSAVDGRTDSILTKHALKQIIERANPNLTIDYTVASVVDVLTYVMRVSRHATECCDRIVAKYKVARHLNIDYDELLIKDPFEIFQFLVLEGAHVLPLTKHFASALCLEKERIALMLAELCYHAVCDLDGNVSRLVAATGSTASFTSTSTTAAALSARSSTGYGDEIVRSGSFVSPSLTPSSSHSDLSIMSSSSSLSSSALLSRVGKAATTLAGASSSSTSPAPLATFFSNKHWSDFVEMAVPRASLVGDEILRLLQSNMTKPNFSTNQTGASGSTQVSSVAYNVEIELIIRSFASYRVGLDVLKQAKLFELIEERVPIYVQAQQFKSLVRLVTGIKLYAQLQYILDILVKYDCFDMLLSRNVYHLEDGDDRKELQLALFNFLKANYPSHIDKMKLLFLRFNMFREYADLLQERGWMHLNTMKSRLDPQTLLQALDSFLEAASMYARDKAYGIESKCLDTANLLQLQFDLPEIRVVNLKEAQAQLFITHCPVFSHAFIVAKSYSLLKLSNWIEPVFQQVIVLSNWNFWSGLELQLPLERGLLFSKIVKRVNQELNALASSSSNKTLINTITTNVRLFLDHLDDHYLRLKYARDLGLTDLVDQLNRVLGAEYTTLIIS